MKVECSYDVWLSFLLKINAPFQILALVVVKFKCIERQKVSNILHKRILCERLNLTRLKFVNHFLESSTCPLRKCW